MRVHGGSSGSVENTTDGAHGVDDVFYIVALDESPTVTLIDSVNLPVRSLKYWSSSSVI